jgi:hypothetical protein
MLTYKIQYRLQGQTFKKTITKVVEDDTMASGQARYFMREDGSRIEVPASAEFYFGVDRAKFIKQLHDSRAEALDDANTPPPVSGNIPGLAFPTNLS